MEWITTEAESDLPEEIEVGLVVDGIKDIYSTAKLTKENGYKSVFENVILAGGGSLVVLDGLPENYEAFVSPKEYPSVDENQEIDPYDILNGFHLTFSRELLINPVEIQWDYADWEDIPESVTLELGIYKGDVIDTIVMNKDMFKEGEMTWEAAFNEAMYPLDHTTYYVRQMINESDSEYSTQILLDRAEDDIKANGTEYLEFKGSEFAETEKFVFTNTEKIEYANGGAVAEEATDASESAVAIESKSVTVNNEWDVWNQWLIDEARVEIGYRVRVNGKVVDEDLWTLESINHWTYTFKDIPYNAEATYEFYEMVDIDTDTTPSVEAVSGKEVLKSEESESITLTAEEFVKLSEINFANVE